MSEILVHITRGNVVESVHRGHIAVADTEGKVLYYAGNPDIVTYFRSAAKPIQALAVVESGAYDAFGLTLKELAVICGSHSGEKEHTAVVMSILEKIGLEEGVLECGIHDPLYRPEALEIYRCGRKPTFLHCNCSGKHSGMLAVAVKEGYPVNGYRDITHPVQQKMLEIIAEVAEIDRKDIQIGIDGCGVPVFGLPLFKMALAYAKLSNPERLDERRKRAINMVKEAVINNPYMVAGTGRICTELIIHTGGRVIAKSGAEGVYCVGLLDKGIGIALKIEDGSSRAIWPSVIHILNQLGALSEEELKAFKKYYPSAVKNNHGEIVGEVRPVFKLRKGDS
ncbi:hypothetical protein H0A61_01611 [Koleobacter methoxysyntrophicus]|uniref:Asparaginase n=1 Tax=Koleobacter methoxysyntrophicus TaxID=2751313 RepID=A0A8A0RNT9_9FIRM|nr:asparaginase [Koleobacter methoxysyntrophicus]QSQ09250.1 hypothetical protein H0A61_01611 [Koleobacter methoxysyntrophicus]